MDLTSSACAIRGSPNCSTSILTPFSNVLSLDADTQCLRPCNNSVSWLLLGNRSSYLLSVPKSVCLGIIILHLTLAPLWQWRYNNGLKSLYGAGPISGLQFLATEPIVTLVGSGHPSLQSSKAKCSERISSSRHAYFTRVTTIKSRKVQQFYKRVQPKHQTIRVHFVSRRVDRKTCPSMPDLPQARAIVGTRLAT